MRIRTTSCRAIAAAIALAALLGCRGAGAGPAGAPLGTALERGAAGAALERQDRGTVVLVAPDGRRTLDHRPWTAGDRVRSGSRSSLWEDEPVGYGFARGGLLPFVRRGDGVHVADLDARTVYRLPAVGAGARNPRLSRGGRFLAYSEDGDLRLLDLRTQLIRTFDTGGGVGIRDLDVDGFGNVAYIDSERRLRLFDGRTGDEFIVPAAGRGLSRLDNVSISGNGRLVAFSGRESGRDQLFLTDLSNGRQFSFPFVRGGAGGSLRPFSLSGDGDRLLYSDGGRLRLLDLDSGFIDSMPLLNDGGEVEDARFLDADGETILFERDGRLLGFDRESGTIDTFPILNRDGDASLRSSRFRFSPLF